MSCGVSRRRGSDLALLWLWCRLVVTAPIRPLGWETPYPVGVALEKTQRQKKKKTNLSLTLLLARSSPHLKLVKGNRVPLWQAYRRKRAETVNNTAKLDGCKYGKFKIHQQDGLMNRQRDGHMTNT